MSSKSALLVLEPSIKGSPLSKAGDAHTGGKRKPYFSFPEYYLATWTQHATSTRSGSRDRSIQNFCPPLPQLSSPRKDHLRDMFWPLLLDRTLTVTGRGPGAALSPTTLPDSGLAPSGPQGNLGKTEIPGAQSQGFGWSSLEWGLPLSTFMFFKRLKGHSEDQLCFQGDVGLWVLNPGESWGNQAKLVTLPAAVLGPQAGSCAVSSLLLKVVAFSQGKAMTSENSLKFNRKGSGSGVYLEQKWFSIHSSQGTCRAIQDQSQRPLDHWA